MRKIVFLVFLILSSYISAQDNTIFEAENTQVRIGKYKYSLRYEYSYQPEGKFFLFSEVLFKDKKKQYIGHFVYQLKNDVELVVSPDHPPRPKLENKIIQSYHSEFILKEEKVIVTTYYYDQNEPIEKEVKTLQQSKKGFFYVKQKQIYYRNGDIKEEKDFPEKIEFVKTDF